MVQLLSIGIGLIIGRSLRFGGSGGAVDNLLLEDDFNLLLEDGSLLVLEA